MRAEGQPGASLEFQAHLRRDVHVASLAGFVSERDDCYPTPVREDPLVLLQQGRIDP